MNSQDFLAWCETYTTRPYANHRPLVMGILNITPDSFSDGGRYLSIEKAIAHAEKLLAAGADLIDIGGESTRPGSVAVGLDEELERVIPVIEGIRQQSDVCLSIDTSKAEVMKQAVSVGVGLINDIKALTGSNSLAVASSLQVPVCLMHMQGIPINMQQAPYYQYDVVAEINDFLQQQITRCLAAGIKREHLIIDPGFGFGKTVSHNLMIIKQLQRFKLHKLPLLLGVSRKNTLGVLLNKPVDNRLIGGVALAALMTVNGVDIIRTHDVDETKQAVLIAQAVMNADHQKEERGEH